MLLKLHNYFNLFKQKKYKDYYEVLVKFSLQYFLYLQYVSL